MNFENIRPSLARTLRQGALVLGVLAAIVCAAHGMLTAAIAGFGVWLVAQALAIVVESLVIRKD